MPKSGSCPKNCHLFYLPAISNEPFTKTGYFYILLSTNCHHFIQVFNICWFDSSKLVFFANSITHLPYNVIFLKLKSDYVKYLFKRIQKLLVIFNMVYKLLVKVAACSAFNTCFVLQSYLWLFSCNPKNQIYQTMLYLFFKCLLQPFKTGYWKEISEWLFFMCSLVVGYMPFFQKYKNLRKMCAL